MRPASHNKNFSLTLQVHLLILCWLVLQATCQLPDDIQRELNQNLAEQARIQAMREQHRNQIQNRVAANQPAAGKQPPHDPNNYSYQQVSPPIQYSYYQPYGDAVQPQTNQQPADGGQTTTSTTAHSMKPSDLDLNNLNFDLPQPQAQKAQHRSTGPQQHYTPSFTGAGGLPVMRPIGGANAISNSADSSYAPAGNAPLAPQAQQGTPLTEADFKDITGGENYGAPSGNDFGLGEASSSGANGGGGGGGGGSGDDSANTDAQLREFGLPAEQPARSAPGRRASSSPSSQAGMPDFGAFGTDFGQPANSMSSQPKQRADTGMDFDQLENLAGGGGGSSMPRSGLSGNRPPTDFDFAIQPSSTNGDQTSTAGGAPGSLQSLLGASFPGLGGGQSNLDEFAGAGNNPQRPQPQQRLDDRALDIADLGDKSDQFSGADLGGFEQPSARNDQDFNYAAAANQQPSVVPYPDGSPQPVGTLLALTQPQSLTQTRYSALPDKGTYQDYPAYQAESSFASVSDVVDGTPRARRPGLGRYSMPSPDALAPEHRSNEPNQHYDYASGPTNSNEADSSDNYDELD